MGLIGHSLCKPASKLDGLTKAEIVDAKAGKIMTEAAFLAIIKGSSSRVMAKLIQMADKYGDGPLRCFQCLPMAKLMIACFNNDFPETFAEKMCQKHIKTKRTRELLHKMVNNP